MRRTLVTVALSLGLGISSCAAETNPELAQFQGDWEVIQLVEDGKVIPREAIREWLPSGGRARIAENAIIFTSRQDGAATVKVFSIDGTRIPKGIDVTSREKEVSQGIYRFDNNQLVVCFSDPKVGSRPDDFSAAAGSQRALMVLSRVADKRPAAAPTAATSAETRQPVSHAAAKVLTDAQVKQMLIGTWQLNDGLGLIYATIHPNGTFSTRRDVQEIRVFQTVFVRTPISSGKWSVSNGQLTYHVSASVYPERAGRTVALFLRSISDKDLIFVDALGRVGSGVKVQ